MLLRSLRRHCSSSSSCVQLAPRFTASSSSSTHLSLHRSFSSFSSRASEEQRIHQLKQQIAKAKGERGVGGKNSFLAGATAFAASEVLAGLVATGCIMGWVIYCVDWSKFKETSEKAMEQLRNKANMSKTEKTKGLEDSNKVQKK